MVDAATQPDRLQQLVSEMAQASAEHEQLETDWLTLAEQLEG